MLNQRARRREFWRRAIAVVIAYAVAAQSVLIVLGGFGLAARADQASPGFELCHHDAQESPASPAGAPGRPDCSHCIFCFAGSQHALIGSPPVLFHRVPVVVMQIPRAAEKHFVARRPSYSIASPRGPPCPA
jgi:hypothetical protein